MNKNSTSEGVVHRVVQSLVGLIALVWLAVLARDSIKVIETVGGVDFYFYICATRDVLLGRPEKFAYFPGFVWVWGGLMKILGQELLLLQYGYLGVVWLGVVLVGGVTLAAGAGVGWSLLSSALYYSILLHFQALDGITEPFVVIPYLVGLLLLAECFTRGRKGLGLLFLGAAGGISICMKQQGALLLLGGAALAPLLFIRKSELRVPFGTLAGGAVMAPVTLLILLFMWDNSLAIVLNGFDAVQSYAKHGTILDHLAPFERLFPIPCIALLGLVLYLRTLFRPSAVPMQNAIADVMLGILILSGIGTLYQFIYRGYRHYGILTIPCIAIAATLVLHRALSATMHKNRRDQVVGLLTVITAGVWGYFSIENLKPLVMYQPLLERRTTAESQFEPYRELCTHIDRDSELYIFPPRKNLIHWMCGTKSTVWERGYGWDDIPKERYLVPLGDERLSHVFVLEDNAGDYNRAGVLELKGEPIRNALNGAGFAPVLTIPSGVLFTRGVGGSGSGSGGGSGVPESPKPQ